MTTYKYKIRNIKVSNESGDRVVVLSSFLEDSLNNQFLLNGNLDLFDVRIPKSILPGSSYATFISSIVTQRISDKYKATLTGSTSHGSDELTINSVSGLHVGMGVSGPGISTATLSTVLSATKVKLSSTVTRVFTGTLTSETVVRTGDIAASSTAMTNLGTTSDLTVGMTITGTSVPAGTVISVITGATTLTMSQAAATTVVGGSITFSPSPSAANVTAVLPAILNSSYRNMAIAGTGIKQDATFAEYLTANSFRLSQNATVSGSQSLTFSGNSSFVFDPANWTLDLSEITYLVGLINFGAL